MVNQNLAQNSSPTDNNIYEPCVGKFLGPNKTGILLRRVELDLAWELSIGDGNNALRPTLSNQFTNDGTI